MDHSVSELRYMDPLCDLFYHIKYMFTGDSIKTDIEGIIRQLRPQLQLRLRFITHLNPETIEVRRGFNWIGGCVRCHTRQHWL